MDVLGWTPSSPHVTPWLATTDPVLWENTSINGLTLQDGISNPSGDSVTMIGFRDLGSVGQFTLNGSPEQAGQWVIVDAGNLSSIGYRAGANPGTDTIEESAFDATLNRWLPDSVFSITTSVEPVASIKNFAVQEGKSLAIAPNVVLTDPSGDNVTEYGFMDAGTNGHFTIDFGNFTAAEPNSQWLYLPSWEVGALQYTAGSTLGTDPIEVVAFDASTESWTAVGTSTATTIFPRITPPPVNLPVLTEAAPNVTAPTSGSTNPTSGTSTAVNAMVSTPADTLVADFTNATLVGTPGNDTFVIGAGAGQEKIQNFDPAHDTLQFSVALFASYSAAMTDARQVGADTVFAIDAHDSVTLQNVNVGNLTASNVHVG
jgi:hypothetical protein